MLRKTPTAPGHIQVRSMYGTVYHFVPADAALCGYESWVYPNTVMDASPQDIIDAVPYQHAGWNWCVNCASILTGLPEDFFYVSRG